MSNIKLFESKQIRTVWSEFDQKWYFSVQDVVQLLTDSADVKDYIKKNKKTRFRVKFQLGDNLSPA